MDQSSINLEPTARATHNSRKRIISLKAKAAAKRSSPQVAADWLAESFGTITFFVINAFWFVGWIFLNSGMVKNLPVFDPFPFSFLTMIVSLEAIFLSIIVLISQNRATKVTELAQELDLQLDTIAEQEITKMLDMLAKIMEHHKIDITDDSALKEMLKPTNTKKMEDELNRQL